MSRLLPNTRLKLSAPSCCGGHLFVKSFSVAPQLKRISLGGAMRARVV